MQTSMKVITRLSFLAEFVPVAGGCKSVLKSASRVCDTEHCREAKIQNNLLGGRGDLIYSTNDSISLDLLRLLLRRCIKNIEDSRTDNARLRNQQRSVLTSSDRI